MYQQYPLLKDYKDVFLEEILGVPPIREFDFSIELIPRAELVSRTPY